MHTLAEYKPTAVSRPLQGQDHQQLNINQHSIHLIKFERVKESRPEYSRAPAHKRAHAANQNQKLVIFYLTLSQRLKIEIM